MTRSGSRFFWPGLFALLAALFAAFHARFLFDWDAAQFALALERFDVLNHRPHPPGYILLVAAGRLMNFFFHDANAALVTLNLALHMLSAVVIFALGRDLFDERTGKIAAVLFAFSPLVLFNSNIACAYAAEGLVALSIAWATYRCMRQGTPEALYQSAMIFGLGGGVRQNLLILLLPLWAFGALYTLQHHRVQTKTLLLTIAILTASVLCWLVPLVVLSGGLSAYRQATSDLLTYQFGQTSIFYGIAPAKFLKIALRLLGWLAITGLGLAAYPLLGRAWLNRQKLLTLKFWRAPTPPFFLLWIAPSFCFYALFHLPKPGYLLTFFSAFSLLAAHSLLEFAQNLPRRAMRWAVGAVVIMGLLQFVALGPVPEAVRGKGVSGVRQAYNLMAGNVGYSAIRQNDVFLEDLLQFINKNFDRHTTALIAENLATSRTPHRRILRHFMAYLPQFTIYEIANPTGSPSVFESSAGGEPLKSFGQHERDGFLDAQSGGDKTLEVPVSQPRLVFFPGDLAPQAATRGWRIMGTPAGQRFYVADLREMNGRVTYGHVTFVQR